MKKILSAGTGGLLLPVALLAGIVLGGLGPRRELERARAEIARLQAQPGGPARADALNVITDVVRIPAAAPARAPDAAPAPEPAEGGAEEPAAEDVGAAAEPAAPAGSLGDRLADAREAWQIRADIARNSFAARTGYGGDEIARFDVVVAAMNLRLRHTFEQLATALSAGEDLTVERGVRMVHELTGALALTYDELDRTLPPAWRAAAGDDFDLTDFVDPSVAEPLVPVEARLENGPRFRRGPRRFGPP